jgi:hypothetical protein
LRRCEEEEEEEEEALGLDGLFSGTIEKPIK